MKRSTIFAAMAAVMLCTTTTFGGEKIKLPVAASTSQPQVTTAVDRGATSITNVVLPRRAYYGGYRPYYAYRPYYGGYGYGYGGYYTRPYYGYSYYAPGWGYGWGPGVGVTVGRPWGPGIGIGYGPVARFGGLYW
jgi:hypothetical protein